jgi:prepilin-type N-terminal cleavage/methylation domain-containing protein
MKKINYRQGGFNPLWFTLIEVIVASAILSITVFWVYKLIWENAKLINNSDNYLQLNNLFLNLEECIKSKKSIFLWLSSWTTKKINFWNSLTWCVLSDSNPVLIDNINYYLNSKITWTWANFIDFELEIEWDWVWIEKKDFRLYK